MYQLLVINMKNINAVVFDYKHMILILYRVYIKERIMRLIEQVGLIDKSLLNRSICLLNYRD